MKVIVISRDYKVLDFKSPAYIRMCEYSELFDELHVVVLAKNLKKKTSENFNNVFFYDTSSRFFFVSFVKSLCVSFSIANKMQHVISSKNNNNWISSQDPFESGIIALIVGKFFGLKIQLQLHTDVFSVFFKNSGVFQFVQYIFAKILLPHAHSIRVVSQRIKDSLLVYKFSLRNRVHVLPIFIDQKKYKNISISVDLKVKYPEFNKIVIIVARLEKEKNIFLSLEAFKNVLKKFDKAGLVIFGSGSQEFLLKQNVKKLGIFNNVRFEGWVEHPFFAYKSSDLLLVTSLYEGYAMNIIEALICGCPVVSTDVGIASEYGATIAEQDSSHIAMKILEELSKEKNIKNISLISKEEYLKKFKETFII